MDNIINPFDSFESKAIRKYANGKSCTVRIPHVCKPGIGTEIMAHPPRGVSIGKGFGGKTNDLLVAIACVHCHDVIDGRNVLPAVDFINDYWAYVENLFWRGHGETIMMMHKDGLINV